MTRKEAIIQLKLGPGINEDVSEEYNDAVNIAIEALSDWNKGEWQKVDEQPYFRKHFDNVCCSICHHKGMRKYNYCPYCGAKMDRERKDDD